eukprot:2107652-Pyramimonas_sp.AAC.1
MKPAAAVLTTAYGWVLRPANVCPRGGFAALARPNLAREATALFEKAQSAVRKAELVSTGALLTWAREAFKSSALQSLRLSNARAAQEATAAGSATQPFQPADENMRRWVDIWIKRDSAA